MWYFDQCHEHIAFAYVVVPSHLMPSYSVHAALYILDIEYDHLAWIITGGYRDICERYEERVRIWNCTKTSTLQQNDVSLARHLFLGL